MRDRVRVAVVGLGQWGQHHVRALASLPGADLVGVVDRKAATARALAHRYGTRGYLDHRDLLGAVDAAVIAVPTALHYAVARDFLEAGAHVLVEKPMTTTLDEAEALTALAGARDRVLLVGHIERFKPAVQRLFPLVRAPLAVQVRRVRPYDVTRTMDVGVVMDLMIHDIDIVQALVPGRIEEIHAIGVRVHNSHEDLAVAQLRLNTGCLVTLTASRVAATKAVDLEVTMADRAVHLDFLHQTLTVRHDRGETQRIKVEAQETLRLELNHFLACVRGEAQPLVSGADGLRAMRLATMVLDRMVEIAPPVRV
ncbi:MAG: Gfo/Idh/MocA family oxidoreductase [Armatimonadota bacterium]|nr:Gfo/Idh/MocA family oxidoreductase [Armatimonadota bacterium]MDR7447628.1 Gfo/Idh/MocA family oxidoreductase [Armatimonadota bacterium]MDR7459491.1 Gfo/Idh/MocA family oxidoreductase [Armatimonadota bacterium]MDR7480065.1 Gfo/Idh/MocA family oxidoreductase [Armatimonadota bacterium]MDR7488804.1 Gfo/Idh/MocA family oxidoreductase [Armatimonadota bacterium]